MKPVDGSVFSGGQTDITMDFFEQAGVARSTVLDAGPDFPTHFLEKERQMDDLGAVIRQVYLPLNRDDAGAMVHVLRSQGYFFGGLLSRWFDHDGLMMQKIAASPNLQDLHLYTDFAREMLKFILDDREAAG